MPDIYIWFIRFKLLILRLVPSAWFKTSVKFSILKLLKLFFIPFQGVLPITDELGDLIGFPGNRKIFRIFPPPNIYVEIKLIFFRRGKVKMRGVIQHIMLTEKNNIRFTFLKCGYNLPEICLCPPFAFNDMIIAKIQHRFQRYGSD